MSSETLTIESPILNRNERLAAELRERVRDVLRAAPLVAPETHEHRVRLGGTRLGERLCRPAAGDLGARHLGARLGERPLERLRDEPGVPARAVVEHRIPHR